MKTFPFSMKMIRILLGTFAWVLTSFSMSGQNMSKDDSLALELQNPLAKLVVLPVNFDFDYGIEPHDGSRNTFQFEPVLPLSIGKKWDLVERLVATIVTQSDVIIEGENETALRDISLGSFFSPKIEGLTIGFGPLITFPTATNELLGSEKWSLGPSFLILKQANKTTLGLLVSQSWSIAGNSDRADVSSALLQPFFAQNFKKAYSFLMASEISQDWEGDFTNGTFMVFGQKLLNFGKLPIQFAAGPRIPFGNGNTTEWGFRIRLNMVFSLQSESL